MHSQKDWFVYQCICRSSQLFQPETSVCWSYCSRRARGSLSLSRIVVDEFHEHLHVALQLQQLKESCLPLLPERERESQHFSSPFALLKFFCFAHASSETRATCSAMICPFHSRIIESCLVSTTQWGSCFVIVFRYVTTFPRTTHASPTVWI